MDLRSRRRYAANVDGNVSDAEEDDVSDDRVPFLQQIDQIDVNDAQEEGSSNNKPFCFEQIFGHCCTIFISFRIYCLKLSCLFKLRCFCCRSWNHETQIRNRRRRAQHSSPPLSLCPSGTILRKSYSLVFFWFFVSIIRVMIVRII